MRGQICLQYGKIHSFAIDFESMITPKFIFELMVETHFTFSIGGAVFLIMCCENYAQFTAR